MSELTAQDTHLARPCPPEPSHTHRTGPATPSLSRRGFIGVSGAAGGLAAAAIVAGGQTATAAAAAPLLPAQRLMIAQLARVGVTFPLALPAYNEPGPSRSRAIVARLRAAQHGMPAGGIALAGHHPATVAALRSAELRMRPGDLERAGAGVDLLIADGLLGSRPAALLEGVGRRAALASGNQHRQLLAAVTLAIATVFPGFDPTTTTPAAQWLSMLAIMHQAGTLRPALRRRGIQ